LVKDLQELDKYPSAGHSAILGNRKNPLVPPEEPNEPNKLKEPEQPTKPTRSLAEKTIEDVLLHFGETQKLARRRYRGFVEKGIDEGRRPEFQGGGLVRSAGGKKAGLLGRSKDEREKGDARILGSGEFVMQALDKANERFERGFNPTTILILKALASFFDVKGMLDDFSLGSILRHQARFRYRTP